jgi:PAS domain S-box-containing protein
MSTGLALFAWRYRSTLGAIPLVVLMGCVAWWSIGYAIQLGFIALWAKVVQSNINYIAIFIIPMAWLAFALQYSGYQKWLTRRILAMLSTVPIVLLVVIWTDSAHQWFRTDIQLAAVGQSFVVMKLTHGIAFWTFAAYAYPLILLGTALILPKLKTSASVYRSQAIVITIGALTPLATNILSTFGLIPLYGIDLTPLSLVITGMTTAFGIFRYQLLDIVPVAHDMIIESMRDGVIVLDSRKRVIDLNPAAQKLLGHSHAQTIGRPSQEIFVEWPELTEYTQKVKVHSEITQRRGEKCQYFDLSISCLRDRGGRATGRLIVLRDITTRKQEEKEHQRLLTQVQEQSLRVQHIVDTVPEGVILLGPDLHVLLANPLGKKDLVTLANARIGDLLTHLGDRPIDELLTPPPQGLWHEVGDQNRNFQAIARPIEHGPTPPDWVLVIRDVTQQREVERRVQQQERLATVGQLAAGMAHDFNNLMAVVALYTGISLHTPNLPEEVRERLQIIGEQAQRASHLIQQILDFSRRSVLERGPLDLSTFLKKQVKLLQRTLPENIQIDLTYGADEYCIKADSTRIQQAIMNLATNARDAMPEGGYLRFDLKRVTFSNRDTLPLPEMKQGQWIRLAVTDAGSGIPPEVQPRVFDPFFTTKEPGKGTGLGLAQVYGIVKQHEGHIDFATELGRGTTFILYLPALTTHPAQAPTVENESLIQGRGQTILVVEDEDFTRQALVDSLKKLNYQILEAADGRQALEIFEQHASAIDLVLSDVMMPKVGGMALIRALQEREPTVPIVLLTGHPLKEQEFENLRTSSLKDWVLKPVSLEKLTQIVAKALDTLHD